ncbi:uncharacterized protein LOC130282757 [Hyla sarda]|uniref:uncharacterized protein LOC130282757 n=1 Tax=Hyla sarda TaxID=327740 RepID=UPI0024C2C2F5|nr:uncharacterized protein LOC130282757 [Hyla sarda]XP_056387362.1 uncharacterized protein LOC130282757 [Hyla sarda]
METQLTELQEITSTAARDDRDLYGPSSDTKAQSVFGNSVAPVHNVTPMDLLTLTRQVENLMIKETKVWWDHKTLTTYLNKNMVPRGLRLKKRPVKVYSQTFLAKWDWALLDCSAKLMKYIVEEEETELADLQKEMENLKTSLTEFKTHQESPRLEEAVLEKLDNIESEIMDIKINKFQRDTHDYNKDQVFTWFRNKSNDTETPRSKSRRRRQPRSKAARSVSFSDADTSHEEEQGCPLESNPVTRTVLTSQAPPQETSMSKNRPAAPKRKTPDE